MLVVDAIDAINQPILPILLPSCIMSRTTHISICLPTSHLPACYTSLAHRNLERLKQLARMLVMDQRLQLELYPLHSIHNDLQHGSRPQNAGFDVPLPQADRYLPLTLMICWP